MRKFKLTINEFHVQKFVTRESLQYSPDSFSLILADLLKAMAIEYEQDTNAWGPDPVGTYKGYPLYHINPKSAGHFIEHCRIMETKHLVYRSQLPHYMGIPRACQNNEYVPKYTTCLYIGDYAVWLPEIGVYVLSEQELKDFTNMSQPVSP